MGLGDWEGWSANGIYKQEQMETGVAASLRELFGSSRFAQIRLQKTTFFYKAWEGGNL